MFDVSHCGSLKMTPLSSVGLPSVCLDLDKNNNKKYIFGENQGCPDMCVIAFRLIRCTTSVHMVACFTVQTDEATFSSSAAGPVPLCS